MKQDNEYSNSNEVKAILLIILIIVITIVYLIYSGIINISFQKKSQKNESGMEPVFETPLSNYTAYYKPITIHFIEI